MKPSIMRAMVLLVGWALVILPAPSLVWAQDYSHARIVRLSFAEGTVAVQRPDVADWAEAPVNTPLQEGFKLSTAENSFAEAEFENGSTVRLGQLTLLEFTQLALAPSGGKLNRLALNQGYATFSVIPEGDDVYEINTPNGTLTPRGKTLFRVDLDVGVERVEVFKGSVDVASSLGTWTLAKNAVLELRPGAEQPYDLAEGITKDAWDEWVEQREGRVNLVRDGRGPRAYTNNVNDLLYGWSDLSTYGMWSYLPGYGYGWIPTVAPGWTPFALGRWCWYPGMGYVWISGDPWGWLPYHYGEWAYMGGMGWAWFPNNFGTWSPATVDWYMGPGWIGWAPQKRLLGGGNANPCAQGQPCGTVVSVDTFQDGKPVTPDRTIPRNPLQGRLVDRLDVPPSRQAMLPGRAVSPIVGLAGAQPVSQDEPRVRVKRMYDGGPGQVTVGASATAGAPSAGPAANAISHRGAPAPGAGIVFDPVEGRYVNNPNVPSASDAKELMRPRDVSPRMTPGGTIQPSSVEVTRPGEARDAERPGLRGNAPTAPSATAASPSSAAPPAARSAPAPSEHRGWWSSIWHHSRDSRSEASPSPGASSSGRSTGSFEGGSPRSGGGGRDMSGSGGGHSSGVSSGGHSSGMTGGGHSSGPSGGGGHPSGSNSSGPRH